MLAKVCSGAVNGIEVHPVEVEVNAGYGDTIIVTLSCILPASARAGQRNDFLRLPPDPQGPQEGGRRRTQYSRNDRSRGNDSRSF
jgi:hypothetical protein